VYFRELDLVKRGWISAVHAIQKLLIRAGIHLPDAVMYQAFKNSCQC